MKTKTLAAIIIAATCISLISCDWLFGKKTSNEKATSLVGKWKIENINDSISNSKNVFASLALHVSAKGSLTIEFEPDSTYGLFQSNKLLEDSGKYYLDSTEQTLFLKKNANEDSTIALTIKSRSDSSLQLFSTDSVYYTLNKE